MTRTLTLVAQFAGWPAAFGLVWVWLSMPEGTMWQLAVSVLLAIVILMVAAALIAGAFGEWRAAGRVLPWLLAAGGLSAAATWRGLHPALIVAPWLIALPGFFWAVGGPAYSRMLGRMSTYIGIAAWSGLAIGIPWKLIQWVPDVGTGFQTQAASAVARLVLAGVCFILAWLGLGSYWRKAAYAKS